MVCYDNEVPKEVKISVRVNDAFYTITEFGIYHEIHAHCSLVCERFACHEQLEMFYMFLCTTGSVESLRRQS